VSDPDPEPPEPADPPERPRVVVALALGLVAAILLAAAAIVITRDLTDRDDPDPSATSAPSASTPASRPFPDSPPPVDGCGSTSETPRGIDGQAAVRALCHKYADRLGRNTDAMFECRIGDRIEDCRPEAGRAWNTLIALQADPAYREARVLIDGAFDLAEVNGRRYRSPDCVGRNETGEEKSVDCATSYSAFGVGLSSLEYLLRSM
jgi:hypothetical protein